MIKKNYRYFKIKFKNLRIEIPRKEGIIVDTNIMLLFLVGCYDINYIRQFKRTRKYSKEEYYFIRELLTRYYNNKVFTSPHILTELSNFSLNIQDDRRNKYFNFFIKIFNGIYEIYVEKNKIIEFKELPKFGITDVAIFNISKENNLLVLTDDIKLTGYLTKNKVDVLNLRNYSPYLWNY